ncbi:MAG: RNA polymerase sigma factor [Novosphingobium sp.]
MSITEPIAATAGLEAVLLANRGALLRFLSARGAGDAAEDILHEVWLRVSQASSVSGPIAAPLAYLYRAANSVMIDRYRARRQAEARGEAWAEHQAASDPAATASPERIAIARDTLAAIFRALQAASPRAATVFRRHRVEEVPQRAIAAELGVSLSTVESDLRSAYRVIAEFRERDNEV